ncbi:MAG: GIY-YIG nuclease family protein [Bacteroidetes bacterium]|nr:GIY-YIG nuclease family protein [Bacteroidota bacterium]
MYHTYILFSKCLNKYYIGFTGDDMIVRLRKHNSNHKGFTGGMGDWNIVHLETFMNESDARKSYQLQK